MTGIIKRSAAARFAIRRSIVCAHGRSCANHVNDYDIPKQIEGCNNGCYRR